MFMFFFLLYDKCFCFGFCLYSFNGHVSSTKTLENFENTESTLEKVWKRPNQNHRKPMKAPEKDRTPLATFKNMRKNLNYDFPRFQSGASQEIR